MQPTAALEEYFMESPDGERIRADYYARSPKYQAVMNAVAVLPLEKLEQLILYWKLEKEKRGRTNAQP